MLDDLTGERVAHHYPEHKDAITLTIYTRAPEKWLLIDRETGQVYEGNHHGYWTKLVTKEKKSDD
jgi:hypothetical protein